MIGIDESFSKYLMNTESVRRSIEEIFDRNGETYYIDLEDIKVEDEELFIYIQNHFYDMYDKLKKAFDTFCYANFNKKLDLSFVNPSNIVKIREIKSDVLGKLVAFEGTVTRTTQVKPEMTVGTFRCRQCNTVIKGVVQQYKFTEPKSCPNHLCNNRSKYEIIAELCEFSNWQRIHVQENPREIPRGSLPRNIDVIVRNELCEKIKPGSQMIFTGYPVVIPDLAFLKIPGIKSMGEFKGVLENEKSKRSLGNELNYKISFFCVSAEHRKEKQIGMMYDLERIQGEPDLYNKLSDSLFPSIHGHINIKNAILLMLVGGTNKTTGEVKIRGDINILIVGDPGTAKSQFLKQTQTFLSRSVYTSGKSSSAAGLTAAVVRDPDAGEFTIEAGALMLSDQGICCIDEFDKMTLKDQVSIHEAMEQQTITIAKAGINATLNARASILAAANPIKGRYDPRKTLRQNINLSPPIMSRFDLYFVITDKADLEHDKAVSQYILRNHQIYNTEDSGDPVIESCFTVNEVVFFIKQIKDRKPVLGENARRELVVRYNMLRQESLINRNNYAITIRHLESLIRLSEALAKIHNSHEVLECHVAEAFRLFKSSLVEIKNEDIILVSSTSLDETVVISDKDYTRITNSLIYLVKNNSFTSQELVCEYLESVEDQIESVASMNSIKRKVELVIEFLMKNEGVLFEIDGVVTLHPDYDI